MAPRRRICRPEETKAGKRAVVNVKGTWAPEEDEVLLQHVKKYGPKDWSSIRSNGLLDRTGKSCRLRWVNKLRPGLKTGKLTPEEADVVIKHQAKLGNKWAEIAKHLTGRTDNDVKNFWSTRQKRLYRQERQLPPLVPESARGKRAVSQRGRGSTFSALSLERRVPQEPSSTKITFRNPKYEVDHNRSQEPLGVIHRIDAPMPQVLCLPAPDVAAMKPESSSMVPYGTNADNPAMPRAEAGLPLVLCEKPTIPCIPQQPSFSNTTFQASKYSVGQSNSQEPKDVKHPFAEVLCLPPTVNATGAVPSGTNFVKPSSCNTTFQASKYSIGRSSSQETKEVKPSVAEALCLPPTVNATGAVPSGTNAEKPLRRAGTHFTPPHHAAFVEPLVNKTVTAPLSLGTNFGGGPFVKPMPVNPPRPQESFVGSSPEPLELLGSPPRDIPYEELVARTRLFFDYPGRFFGITYT